MLNFRENRDRLIKKAIESVQLSEVVEFEYEPSEIITALFEESFTRDSKDFRNRKLKELKEIAFFPNSSKYIKKRDT